MTRLYVSPLAGEEVVIIIILGHIAPANPFLRARVQPMTPKLASVPAG